MSESSLDEKRINNIESKKNKQRTLGMFDEPNDELDSFSKASQNNPFSSAAKLELKKRRKLQG